VLGGSVAVAVAGTVFGVASASDADTLATTAFPVARHDELASRVEGRAVAANVLFGIAAAGAVTAVVLWLVD
jgi:hypothetical protein